MSTIAFEPDSGIAFEPDEQSGSISFEPEAPVATAEPAKPEVPALASEPVTVTPPTGDFLSGFSAGVTGATDEVVNAAKVAGRTIGGGIGATFKAATTPDRDAELTADERRAKLNAELQDWQASPSDTPQRKELVQEAVSRIQGDLAALDEHPEAAVTRDAGIRSRRKEQDARNQAWQETLSPEGLQEAYGTDPALEHGIPATVGKIAGGIANVVGQGVVGSAVGLPYLPVATLAMAAGEESRNAAEAGIRQSNPAATPEEISKAGSNAEQQGQLMGVATGLLFGAAGKGVEAVASRVFPATLSVITGAAARVGAHGVANMGVSAVTRATDALISGKGIAGALEDASTFTAEGVGTDWGFAFVGVRGAIEHTRQIQQNAAAKARDAGLNQSADALEKRAESDYRTKQKELDQALQERLEELRKEGGADDQLSKLEAIQREQRAWLNENFPETVEKAPAEVTPPAPAALAKAAAVHAPTVETPHIVSTAIKVGDQVFHGPEPLSSHQDVMKQAGGVEGILNQTGEVVDLNEHGGFMVVDEKGEHRFATRKEASDIGKLSGQVPEDFKGTLHSQEIKPPGAPQPTQAAPIDYAALGVRHDGRIELPGEERNQFTDSDPNSPAYKATFIVKGPVTQEAVRSKLAEKRAEFAPKAPEVSADTELSGLRTEEIPVESLSLSEDVPQFKSGADEKGVVEPLGGKFDRTGVAPIQVWRRKDGRLEIISGRHRFDLAQRSGEKTIPAQIHDESKGFDAQSAARLDAELNIRDGQGSTSDYASYFKHSDVTEEEANAAGLLARAKGRAGFSIAKSASEDVFALHQSGKLTDAQAEAVASAAPGNDAAQRVGLRAITSGASVGDAANAIKAAVLGSKGEKASQGDFFSETGLDEQWLKQGKVATQHQRDIREQISAVQGASKKPEVAKRLGVDVKDPAGTQKRVAELRADLARWENWPTHPDLAAITRGETKPAEPLPTLRRGENQGDLLSTQTEDLTLVGEKGVDTEKKAQEDERIARERDEAKAQAEADQGNLFGAAVEALTGMKRATGESGSTTIPDIIVEAGKSIYRRGMEFADWSSEMVRKMGEAITPHLEKIWTSLVETINAASPAERRFKKSGGIGKAQSDEIYGVFADDVHRAKVDTKPSQDFTEADKQAVVDAYQELRDENGQGSQRIADVMERAGFPLSATSKGLVIEMFNKGQVTGLAFGDWSLSNDRTRAWGVRRVGDVMLRMEMPAGMKRSAPSPEGGAVGGQGGRRGPSLFAEDEAGTEPPERDAREELDTTKVFGKDVAISGRPHLTPADHALSEQHAADIFKEAGLDVVKDADGWFTIADNFTSQEVEGRKLLELIKREIPKQNSQGQRPIHHLLNSALNLADSGNEAFTRSLRNDLFAVAQGERSQRGIMLAALRGARQTLSFAANHVDAILKKTYSSSFDGEAVRRILDKVVIFFRDQFTPEELDRFRLDHPDLERAVNTAIELTRREQGGKIYRRIQGLFKPTRSIKLHEAEADARVKEAVQSAIDELAKQGVLPAEKNGRKLTALEALGYLTRPQTKAKLEQELARAIDQGQRNAGIENALRSAKDDAERQDLSEYFSGGGDPTAENIEAGLESPMYSHWKTLRDSFVGYDPTTLKAVRNVISEGFTGVQKPGAKPMAPKPKISLTELAKSPAAEVARTIDAWVSTVMGQVDLNKALPETRARVEQMIRDEVQRDLTAARQKVLDNYFNPKELAQKTASEKLKQLVNAGLSADPRLKDNRVLSVLRRIAADFARSTGLDLADLAGRTRSEKTRAISDAVEAISKQEGWDTLPDQTRTVFEGGVFRDIAERLHAAEDNLSRSLLAGKDADYSPKVAKTDAERQADRKSLVERLRRKINAGAADSAMIETLAAKTQLQRLVPNISTLSKQILETPFYSQTDLTEQFAQRMTRELGIDPALSDKISAAWSAAFEKKADVARGKALEMAKASLTPRDQKAMQGNGEPLWNRITRAVNAGLFDSNQVLEDFARDRGWNIPTNAERQRIKELADRMQRLNELTPEEAAKYPDDASREVALRKKQAVTERSRTDIQREMQRMWATWTKPLRIHENRLAAINELTTSNLLLRASFFPRQLIDVLSQNFIHAPMRAFSEAVEQVKADRLAGKPVSLLREASLNYVDALRDRILATPGAFRAGVEGLAGRGETHRVLGMTSDVKALERIEARARQAWQNGDHGTAIGMSILGQLKWGMRFSKALDDYTSVLVQRQELREQIVRELREQGDTSEVSREHAKAIMGDAIAEFTIARAHAQAVADAAGLTLTESQMRAATWDLVHENQLARARLRNLPVDDFTAQSKALAETVGWNRQEIGYGVGGALGAVVKASGGVTAALGLPSPQARFANAIATGTNRALHFTVAGFFPKAFRNSKGEYSSWLETSKDRTQRKLEAALGTGVALALGSLAATGVLRVWNAPPMDKEDRDKWTKEGHQAGTVEFHYGDGKWVTIGMSSGPLSYVRFALAAIGSVQDWSDRTQKQDDRMARAAMSHGKIPTPMERSNASDLLAVLLGASITGVGSGRTAGGLQSSLTDWDGSLNVKKIASSMGTSLVPFLPLEKSLERAAGVDIDPKKSSVLELLAPAFVTSVKGHAQRVNFFGDPLNEHTAGRVLTMLTGSAVPMLHDIADASKERAYAIVMQTGWTPPSISEKRLYKVGPAIGPLGPEQQREYQKARGPMLKEALSALPGSFESWDRERQLKALSETYRNANERALRTVGAKPISD